VIGPDRTVHMRPVKVAQISEGQALIDLGLKPNETVVLEGQYRLESGSLVEELHGKAADSADLQSAVEQAIGRLNEEHRYSAELSAACSLRRETLSVRTSAGSTPLPRSNRARREVRDSSSLFFSSRE
jgi:hypothetical protein